MSTSAASKVCPRARLRTRSRVLTIATEKKSLTAFGITHVVSVCDNRVNQFEDVKYHTIQIMDIETASLRPHFEESIRFIHEARRGGGIVLIHCMAGVSRSSTILIAYLLAMSDLTLDQALSAAKAARPIVRPNDGFLEQLHAFQKDGLAEIRAALDHLPTRNSDLDRLRDLHTRPPPQPAAGGTVWNPV
eukprot:m.38979 g.38979  ORF g.38979 m.38979 type:complete len:190 (+) comp5541_c0_seq2:45-614(+)